MVGIPFSPGAPGSSRLGLTITKSDTTVYNPPLSGIYIGGAGNLTIVMAGDDPANPVTLTAPPVGSFLNLNIAQVMAATTATLLVGFR